MPVTPFHFGPGIFLKSLFRRKFSLTVFILSQIIIDLEVLWHLFLSHNQLHGFFHTYLGSFVVIGISFLTIVLLKKMTLNNIFFKKISKEVVIFSAALGAFSHVFLDSVMHSDLMPFYPFTENNFMLGKIPLVALHMGCIFLAMMGAIIWIVTKIIFSLIRK